MNKEDLKFKVDQLRKDKIVYATESAAVTLIALFLFSSLQVLIYQFQFIQQNINTIISVIILVPLLYWIYAIIGNFIRCLKIKKLEKELREDDEKKNISYRRNTKKLSK